MTPSETTIDLARIDHAEIERRARKMRAQALADGFTALRRWLAATPSKSAHSAGKAA